jgi:hypothetical protein
MHEDVGLASDLADDLGVGLYGMQGRAVAAAGVKVDDCRAFRPAPRRG